MCIYIYIHIRNSISNEQGNVDATSTALRVVLSTLHVFATDTRSIFARTNGTEVITVAETSDVLCMEVIHCCDDFEDDAAGDKNVQCSCGLVTHYPAVPHVVQLRAVVEYGQNIIIRTPFPPYVLISIL